MFINLDVDCRANKDSFYLKQKAGWRYEITENLCRAYEDGHDPHVHALWLLETEAVRHNPGHRLALVEKNRN
jgi:hypothetical protein